MSDQEDEMIIDQRDPTESLFSPGVISLDMIESGMMIVSSVGSGEFLKYVTGPKFEEDLHDLVKELNKNISST